MRVLKINESNGDVIWDNYYGTGGIWSGMLHSNGSYYATGRSNMRDSFENDVFVLKLVGENPFPDFDLGNDTIISTNDTLLLDAGSGYSSYEWNDSLNNQTLEVIGEFVGVGEHEYWILVTDNEGCYITDSLTIEVVYYNISSKINSHDFVKVYPNPTNNLIKVEFKNYQELEVGIKIHSINGKILYDNLLNKKHILEQIDISNLSSGIYFLTIKSDKFIKKVRIIKQ